MGTCAFDFNFKCIELMNIYYCHNIYFLTKQSVSVPFFFLTKTMTSRLAMLSWMSSKMSDFFFSFFSYTPDSSSNCSTEHKSPAHPAATWIPVQMWRDRQPRGVSQHPLGHSMGLSCKFSVKSQRYSSCNDKNELNVNCSKWF